MTDNNVSLRGMITRGVGGLYSVRLQNGDDVLARARGHFRRDKLTPTVGDRVVLCPSVKGEQYYTPDDETDENRSKPSKNPRAKPVSADSCASDNAEVSYVIDSIDERHNILIRPPVSNLEMLFAVIPCASPEPDLLTVDKLTAIAEYNDINVVIVINKADLSPEKADEIEQIYTTAGYDVFRVSGQTGDGIDGLRSYISEKVSEYSNKGIQLTSAFAGVSGAGKSTIMSRLFPILSLKTGAISRKTERGRHTTRHVELYPAETAGGTLWIADTPGFSILDFTRFDFFPVEFLGASFREMTDSIYNCKYRKCTHLCEEGCAVIEKIKHGGMAPSRHESYKRIYEEMKAVPEWKRRQE